VQALMSAEADVVCGALYGTRSAERLNLSTELQNGYRVREWDTRAGTVPAAETQAREACEHSYPLARYYLTREERLHGIAKWFGDLG
jgi:hypothetical protein